MIKKHCNDKWIGLISRIKTVLEKLPSKNTNMYQNQDQFVFVIKSEVGFICKTSNTYIFGYINVLLMHNDQTCAASADKNRPKFSFFKNLLMRLDILQTMSKVWWCTGIPRFSGFRFPQFFRFIAVYNSILFSSLLVLLSNLYLHGFYFRGFSFESPY